MVTPVFILVLVMLVQRGISAFDQTEINKTKPLQELKEGFPDGTVVKNLPASAGNTGSSSGLGRSHMLQSS